MGSVAQPVDLAPRNPKVPGSIPAVANSTYEHSSVNLKNVGNSWKLIVDVAPHIPNTGLAQMRKI